jgi:hypothetical protein
MSVSRAELKVVCRQMRDILASADHDFKLTELYTTLPFSDSEHDVIMAHAYLRYGCPGANMAWVECYERVKALVPQDIRPRLLMGLDTVAQTVFKRLADSEALVISLVRERPGVGFPPTVDDDLYEAAYRLVEKGLARVVRERRGPEMVTRTPIFAGMAIREADGVYSYRQTRVAGQTVAKRVQTLGFVLIELI